MKRNVIISFLLIGVLLVSIGALVTTAARPPRTTLNVSITSPTDGLEVETGGTFDVAGIVTASKGDAGLVMTYVQYASGEGSTSFMDLSDSDPSVLHIVSGAQPQTQSLTKDASYIVSWTLTGPAGTYEIRIRSEGELAKSGESTSVAVHILAPPPPPGVEVVTAEEVDPAVGYGTAIGDYSSTYSADGLYEILSEGQNTWGTKKPVDDTTELGWIYTFDLPTPRTATKFYFYGYAEFPDGDTDTAFLIQAESGASWSTILTINYSGTNRLRQATLTDDTSAVIRLRIIDNDQTAGNREISSLHIDQAIIGVDDYRPPTSGIEILTAPYTCHRFQAWENFQNSWYHDVDIPIQSDAVLDIEVVDLDFDGNNEIVVSETVNPTYGVGVIEIFDFDISTSPVETLLLPSTTGAALDITVGNFDTDPDYEIAAATAGEGDGFIWDKVDGHYQIALQLHDAGVYWCVTSGNLDADPELEIVFGESWDPVQNKVVLYDYDPDSNTWINSANYTNFANEPSFNGSNWFYRLDIADINNDGQNELYVMYTNGPFRILTYTGDELVDFWAVPDVIMQVDVGFSFVIGDITNDGNLDLVFYSPFLATGTGFMVFEYDDINGFVNTYDISNPGMENVFGGQMAIGDVDGDLLNELVVAGGPGGIYSEGMLYIYRYDSLIFSAALNANDSNCVVICDYDNDAL